MTNTILYERDIDALAIKSQLLNNEAIMESYYIKKDGAVFFMLSLIYGQMSKANTEQEKAEVRNSWNEAELYSHNKLKWKSLMANDYSSFDRDDLKILADNIEDYVSYDGSDEDKDEDESEEVADEETGLVAELKKYEHIEEEDQSLKQKLSKKRTFTQYIVIDGHLYAREVELTFKEFDGDIDKKSDLERLKQIFEKEYEDIVVGAENYYEKWRLEDARDWFDDDDDDDDDDDYYEDDDDDEEVDEDTLNFFNECVDFTNVLLEKLP